ncbi:hypothetical protein LOK49_LG10G00530 [Camellia lanceoleosa]|uniref:Uncharacterized protein n=1 Tax=Camellia lanceoleosa TaxID=1840588 RepID=A0ACC0G4Y9_9ERIC|nr:hypothetical protein LOK49_LG10G00530 [Camellia lanceoleosa]
MIKLNPSHTLLSISSNSPPTPSSLSHPISNFNFPRLSLLRPRQKPKSKIIRSSVKETELLEDEDVELLVETCITRTLPPVLMLEHGLQMIKDAVDELKSNPPRFNSGMYRFQVAVPPSAKALNWFCYQPESSGVFPQFFLSKERNNPTFRSLSLSGVHGVFGIGTAVLFKGSSSCASSEWSSIKRPVIIFGPPQRNVTTNASVLLLESSVCWRIKTPTWYAFSMGKRILRMKLWNWTVFPDPIGSKDSSKDT